MNIRVFSDIRMMSGKKAIDSLSGSVVIEQGEMFSNYMGYI